MRVSEDWRRSLLARLHAVHALWQRGVTDLTLEQANRVERDGVLPIAFTLLHYVWGEDRNGTRLLEAGPQLWDTWAAKVRLAGAPPERGTPMAEAMKIRIGDVDAWRAYQTAVFARTESALAALPIASLDAYAFDGVRPQLGSGSFLAAFVPEGPIRVAELCEAYVYQHACRHLGELDHARGLAGLGGVS